MEKLYKKIKERNSIWKYNILAPYLKDGEKILDFGSGDIVQGMGAGVRVKTPIGPVKLDMGYPLDDVEGEKKKLRFYFNISQGF